MDTSIIKNLFDNFSENDKITEESAKRILNVIDISFDGLDFTTSYTFNEFINLISTQLVKSKKKTKIKISDVRTELLKNYDKKTCDYIIQNLSSGKNNIIDSDELVKSIEKLTL